MIIDGKAIAQRVREEVKAKVSRLSFKPHLAVVLASDDPASAIYVKSKGKAAEETGIHSTQHTLPATTSKQDLLALVDRLNRDPDVDGILVQLPLPDHHDEEEVIRSIDPLKDVDGLHPFNAGKLARGDEDCLIPCTPRGCIRLIEEATKIEGKRAVVVGRSRLVGRPVADLLLNRHATVTTCHSRTKFLDEVIGRADIVVAALGKREFIRGQWIKFGATVIDVGINRDANTGKLFGDVAFHAAKERAHAITPVPGGVGPMTIACLLDNTVKAAERRRK